MQLAMLEQEGRSLLTKMVQWGWEGM